MSTSSFHSNTATTLGVELELQVLDPRTMEAAAAADAILAAVPRGHPGAIKPEFFDCCIEVATGVCRDVDEARRDLEAGLSAAGRAASSCGVLLGWGGTHPFSRWDRRTIVPSPRYRELAERYRDTLCRQLTFGMHVHVAVPDGDSAIRACNGLVENLPPLLALSANSPFWYGRPTGLLSSRTDIMDASPSAGLPPRLRGWWDYERLVERLLSSGLLHDVKELWWDVRPNPELGTVEVRICDMPSDLDAALALAALIHCLTIEAALGNDAPLLDEAGFVIARQNRWLAARYGMAAILVDPRTGAATSARDGIHHLIDRLARHGDYLNCRAWLERAGTMADAPTGAERQLAIYESTGDLAEVVRLGLLPAPRPGPLRLPATGPAPLPEHASPGGIQAPPTPLMNAG